MKLWKAAKKKAEGRVQTLGRKKGSKRSSSLWFVTATSLWNYYSFGMAWEIFFCVCCAADFTSIVEMKRIGNTPNCLFRHLRGLSALICFYIYGLMEFGELGKNTHVWNVSIKNSCEWRSCHFDRTFVLRQLQQQNEYKVYMIMNDCPTVEGSGQMP